MSAHFGEWYRERYMDENGRSSEVRVIEVRDGEGGQDVIYRPDSSTQCFSMKMNNFLRYFERFR